MKSLLLIFIAVISFQSFAAAQSFHAGIKVGANINKLSGMPFKDQFTYGYHAGAFAEIGLGKKWFLQPEVIFNQVENDTASNFSQLYNISTTKAASIKLNYLSVPLLLNYRLSKMISLQAGPQYAILIDHNNSLLQNGKTAFKDGDFSMLGGLQVKLGNLRVMGRYAIGLTNLNDIDKKDQWKNQSIQLGVGFTIL